MRFAGQSAASAAGSAIHKVISTAAFSKNRAKSNEILCIRCIADFIDFGGKSWDFGQSGAVSSARGCCRRRNRQETHRRSPCEPYAPSRDVRGHPEAELILSPESPDFPKFAHFELLIAEGSLRTANIFGDRDIFEIPGGCVFELKWIFSIMFELGES